MTNCPPRLRGDLSKWLCEINTGVYVGNVSSRVRDAVWDRVCQNLKNGQATLVYTAAGEQRMEFRTHNTSWEAVDFDGIKLMRRPLPQTQTEAMDLKPGFSKAAKYQMATKNGTADCPKARKKRLHSDRPGNDRPARGDGLDRGVWGRPGAGRAADGRIFGPGAPAQLRCLRRSRN